ncbi:MAG: flavin reductase family protein [Saprospiraceae bacterium]
MKIDINPSIIPTKDLHQYIIGAVSPRPIAFVSTKDENGRNNLAPYSFFNAFSSNPPILVFSSNRKVSDNTTKDTLHNVEINGECVVNVVPYAILRQMSLASVEFPSGVSEFEKVGLTPEKSETVQCPRVAESPINLECKVQDIITLGEHGGAGHLIICEVTHIAIQESVLDNGRIDPRKLDLMGRMGRNWYVRVNGDALLELHQNVTDVPLGFDRLPLHILRSHILSGNDLGALAALANVKIPLYDIPNQNVEVHIKAKSMIKEGKAFEALELLMST